MNAPDALEWVARLAGLALAIDALELWVVRRRACAIWRDALVARDLAVWPAPIARAMMRLVGERAFAGVIATRGAAALALVALGPGPWAAVALATSVLVGVRWRGTYNGGSDQMMVVLLSALALASLDPARLGPVALAYVAAQVVLSYVIAGVVKVAEPAWRRGDALRRLVQLPRYAVPTGAARAVSHAARPLAWAAMALECLSPLALVDPRAAAALLVCLFGFHVANGWALGLNRFVLVWAAGYPAVVWASRIPHS